MSKLWRLRWLTRGWRRSNCMMFVLAIYLLLRRSRVHWGVFHMLHGRIGTRTGRFYLVSYKLIEKEKRNIEPLFRGQVERGDA